MRFNLETKLNIKNMFNCVPNVKHKNIKLP
jgi:hypothetical protein